MHYISDDYILQFIVILCFIFIGIYLFFSIIAFKSNVQSALKMENIVLFIIIGILLLNIFNISFIFPYHLEELILYEWENTSIDENIFVFELFLLLGLKLLLTIEQKKNNSMPYQRTTTRIFN